MNLMFNIRESLLYAYLLGVYETFRWGDGMGMTHITNGDWNDAYDAGMNHVNRVFNRI